MFKKDSIQWNILKSFFHRKQYSFLYFEIEDTLFTSNTSRTKTLLMPKIIVENSKRSIQNKQRGLLRRGIILLQYNARSHTKNVNQASNCYISLVGMFWNIPRTHRTWLRVIITYFLIRSIIQMKKNFQVTINSFQRR